jgi:hypothetical protein
MFCYFVGGSLGSLLATFAWGIGQWSGVSIVGCAFVVVALIVFALNSKNMRMRALQQNK